MRYEPFYPFASNESASPQPRQNNLGYYHPLAGPGHPGPQGPPQSHMANQTPPPNPFGNWAPGGGLGQQPQNQQAGQGQGQAQGPSKIESYMQTADKLINTAQQFAPVVQQIAPMVQNLPAMWKLYKGFQSLPDQGAQPPGGPTGGRAAARSPQPPTQSAFTNPGPQPSTPRIFQPPQ